MATIYSEAVLAQETRIKGQDGEIHGGPVYYIKKAFPNGFGKFLAGFFAVAAVLALGFMGSMVQSNSIAETCLNAFNIPVWVMGVAVALFSAFIFLGGVQRLAAVTEKMVPLMALLYIIGGLVILGINFKQIPETFGMIFRFAFTPEALIGGGIGAALKTAISQGAKRGLFSNEAGMGSTPHAHAMANVAKPHDQGVAAMIGVFIDTFIVLTMTALVVISCLYAGEGGLGNMTSEAYLAATTGENAIYAKTTLMQTAFSGAIGNEAVGKIFVAICLFFFALSTIIGWNFFGKINAQYLTKNSKVGTVLYAIISIAFIFLGSILSNDLVWELTDFFNYLMVIPNVIALVALAKVVANAAKSAKKDKK